MMGQGRMIKKLLGQPLNDNKSDANLSFESRVDKTFLRPSTSQTASYLVGAPLACLDRSSDGNFALVAGEKVFKILKVDGTKIAEEIDLRAAISNQGNGHNETINSFRDKLNIRTARWMHGSLHSTIVAASAYGKLTLYDVNRLGAEIEVGRIREHDREVHSISINPNREQQFLTACHDGTARLFDINQGDMSRGQTFKHKVMYRPNADAIRDIKWSPTHGSMFACGTSSGCVQLWDRRNNNKPVLNLKMAHRQACTSLSWHPDGVHVISGGTDYRCHVWNLSESGEKRQAAKFSICTPAPVSRVSWRPAYWSSTAQAKRAAQVAVVYDDINANNTKVSTVHIWDLARPSLPFREVCDFETSPSGLVWHDRDLFWSVNRNGYFEQTDVAFAPKVIDRRSLSTFDFSPSGDVLMLLEKRRGRSRSLSPDPSEPSTRKKISGSQSQSPSGGTFSGSRSDSDEDVVGSFLGGKSTKSRRSSRRHSTRSVNSLSTTPPSLNSGIDKELMGLDDAVKVTGPYRPQQVMALGHTPSTAKRGTYQYLSASYMEAILQDKRDEALVFSDDSRLGSRLSAVLEQFAKAAETVGHFRLAQTWKILAYTMSLLLDRRAEYHRSARLSQARGSLDLKSKDDKQPSKDNKKRPDQQLLDDDTPKKSQRPKSPLESLVHPAAKSIIAEEMESTSNMTTPQARPVRDSTILDKDTNQLSSMEHDELSLPPAAHSAGYSPRTVPSQPSPDELPESSSEGYDFYDMGSLATQAIDISAHPPRKAPLRLDYDEGRRQSEEHIGRVERHDSTESFEMFSTSGESRRTRFPSSSESGEPGSVSMSNRRVSEIESSWDSSGPSDSRGYRSFDSNHSGDQHHMAAKAPELRLDDSHLSNIESEEHAMFEAGLADARAEAESKVDELSPFIIDKDYLPQASDPSFIPPPIDPHILVQRNLHFEVQTGVLNAAAMILALKPFLQEGTIDDIQAAAILRQYHHRLSTMELFTEAALLRKLSYPDYRSTYSQGLYNITISFLCSTCGIPMDTEALHSSSRLQKCQKCKTYLEGCAICQMFEPHPEDAFDIDEYRSRTAGTTPSTPGSTMGAIMSNHSQTPYTKETARLWWYCQGCGHGGHTKCMLEWHGGLSSSSTSSADDSPSGGCCPLEGCLHPCLPGKYRDEFFSAKLVQSSDQTGKATKENLRSGSGAPAGARSGNPGVKRDERAVGESRAVESVRGKLSISGGGGPISSGSGGTSMDKKKSVKVVAPGEERRR